MDRPYSEIGICLHGAEGDFAIAIFVEDQHGGLDEVEVTAVTEIELDISPAANQRTHHWARHGTGSASSSARRARSRCSSGQGETWRAAILCPGRTRATQRSNRSGNRTCRGSKLPDL